MLCECYAGAWELCGCVGAVWVLGVVWVLCECYVGVWVESMLFMACCVSDMLCRCNVDVCVLCCVCVCVPWCCVGAMCVCGSRIYFT